MFTINIKRIYESPSIEDGYRILVDRLWPRGISKDKAKIDEWAKNIAPSTELRKEFHQDPQLSAEFKMKYTTELEKNEQITDFLDHIKIKLQETNITFLYAAKDREYNHAVILKEWLEKFDGISIL